MNQFITDDDIKRRGLNVRKVYDFWVANKNGRFAGYIFEYKGRKMIGQDKSVKEELKQLIDNNPAL